MFLHPLKFILDKLNVSSESPPCLVQLRLLLHGVSQWFVGVVTGVCGGGFSEAAEAVGFACTECVHPRQLSAGMWLLHVGRVVLRCMVRALRPQERLRGLLTSDGFLTPWAFQSVTTMAGQFVAHEGG